MKGKDTQVYSIQDIEAANKSLDIYLDRCSDRIFKTYLPKISAICSVAPFEHKGELSDSVAYFTISKFVENQNEKIVDCLKSVYHVLANSGAGVALVIHRKQNYCEIGMAVGNDSGNSERTIKDAQRLRDSFLGNFPGSSCSNIKTDSGLSSELFVQVSENYIKSHHNSIAVVSNVATEFADDFTTQGIEKLLDGIRPSSEDKEYTIIILGEAFKIDELNRAKEELYACYSGLSPFASKQISLSVSEAKQKGWNWSLLLGGQNFGTTNTTDNGYSWDAENYKVKHTLEVIEKQMERLEESSALGLWNFAAYITSPDLATTNEVAHMYMSLTQGRESYTEQSAINVWNGQNDVNAGQIKRIINYISFLRHPKFQISNLQSFEDREVTATTIVSGAEFARALSLPQKSVSGLPVFSCARFGRSISTYGERSSDLFEIGKIYHMRQTDSTPVMLDKKSLASHVFITGSTGAGKSNTVFQILREIDIPFLVIEPAKGEYKDVFGGCDDVKVLGTNPKITELLRINPFSFPENISVSEHIDRLVELFNVCWPMYAAMPAILKDSIIRAYESAGWDMELSENRYGNDLFPTFIDVLDQIRIVLNSSDYSADNKSDYTGALVTRIKSLTNGINGQIFSAKSVSEEVLFEQKVIVDLSRVGSTETRALIMGLLVMKLQEYRLSSGKPNNAGLKHITVLEEAHNILKKTSTEQTSEGANLLGKSVEMLTNSIAELRSFGEGFIIADQAPGLLDMAVIRNTNTKIIHRLPERTDRELAGKSAGLNDEQIEELAKLELGVAAVYQNDWIEPILCKVNEFSDADKQEFVTKEATTINKDNAIAHKMVQDVLLKPNEFIKIDLSLIMKSNLPAQLKIMMADMCKGNMISDQRKAKAFYLLFPSLRLKITKDSTGKYLKQILTEIDEKCGELSASEKGIASSYLIAMSVAAGQLGENELKELRKEMNANVSNHS